ncbi:MAG: hypothetical protein ACLR60_18910 [Clostridium paraputrificum]
MGRLKKGEQKKVQMTIRVEPDVAEKLKKIEKYNSKVGAFIDVGIYEYEKWLTDFESDDIMPLIESDFDIEFDDYRDDLSDDENLLNFFENKDVRDHLVSELKKFLIPSYKTKKFCKFHEELFQRNYEELEKIIDSLENWEKRKEVFLSFYSK